jgi:hypothetical protein
MSEIQEELISLSREEDRGWLAKGIAIAVAALEEDAVVAQDFETRF